MSRESLICEVSPDCLKCPLPACKHDDYPAFLVWRQRVIDGPVAELTAQGMAPPEIAVRVGRTPRSVIRALERIRNRNYQKEVAA